MEKKKEKVTAADLAQISATQHQARVVAGVAQFTGHGGLATTKKAQLLEQAMSDAVLRALADGVSINDSETIKAYKAAARQAVNEALGA